MGSYSAIYTQRYVPSNKLASLYNCKNFVVGPECELNLRGKIDVTCNNWRLNKGNACKDAITLA